MIATQPTDELDDVIEEHRTTWLRQAEATLMDLDPRAYADAGMINALDFAEIGIKVVGILGFAAEAELHVLASHLLPERDLDAPAAAVAVNVDRIARTTPALSTMAGDRDPVGMIRAAVAAVAAHELAHVLDAEAAGRRLPPGATLDQVVRSLTDGRATAPVHQATAHGAGWLRAYLHLVVRASRLPEYRTWLARLTLDVKAVLPHEPARYLDALREELVAHRRETRLVEILRTPAPAGFLSLFTR